MLLELAEIERRCIRQVALRPDCRQLRLFLDDEHLHQVSAWVGAGGEASLEVDPVSLRGLGELAALTQDLYGRPGPAKASAASALRLHE